MEEQQSYQQFLTQLASNSSTPGGGGASALVGGIGIALASMVGNFTLGKQKYADVQEDIEAMLAKAEDLRHQFLALMKADEEAFAPLSKAYGIPKDDPNRDAIMEQCLRDAAAPPMEIVRLTCQAIDLHKEMLEKGSVMLASDVGTGVVFCWSALYGAALNVKVNTKSMADRTYAEALNQEVDQLTDRYWQIAEQVYKAVMGRFCS